MPSRLRLETSGAWPGWLSVSAVAAVVAVGAAGAAGWWSVAVARRGAVEGAVLAFEKEVASRARVIESRLAGARGDLAFLANSAPLGRVGFTGPAVEDWRESGAESAILLFLRGHPEVVRVVALSSDRTPLFHAGRRGGVPLLWVAPQPTGLEGVAVAPGRRRLLSQVTWRESDEQASPPALEIEVEPSELLPPLETGWNCELTDASGTLLGSLAAPDPDSGDGAHARVRGEASIEAEGWSSPSPWRLACDQGEAEALALVEPLVGRYRTTLLVAPAVMALTLLLGFFAVKESRRRERIEILAREQARTRALEQQLFHADRLATVGRLAAGIAHEINNPLEGMSNWLSLARQELARGRVDEVDGHLLQVKEGLDRAAGIVRQVLVQAEPSSEQSQEVDLHQVIRDTSRLVQSRKEFRGIAFRLDFAPGPLLVRGNPITLGQVTLNLLLNACEVQPEGGEVRVSTGHEDGMVVAEFADRGQGVPEADRARIFEPFFSTKGSTGLGLSICHGIVRQHQGDLTLIPREGGGSVFRLALPGGA